MRPGPEEDSFMQLRRAVVIAACMFPYAAVPAAAQFQPAPQQQQAPPCVLEFSKLRDDAQKKAAAIRAASERKATPKEACGLLNAFSVAEVKLIKYAAENSTWCGIPAEVVTNLKQTHAKTEDLRVRVCRAAAAGPPRPAGPSLSDSLGSTVVPDANNIKTGRGTYDTLTGTPLGSR
jgi:hypothetical protein